MKQKSPRDTDANTDQLVDWRRPITRGQLAELVGVHVNTVLRWEANGLIRTIWMGGKKRVPPTEVARIIEEGVNIR